MKGRFIITEHLNTSPVLIGSDFMVKKSAQQWLLFK
jgi:hypothetical protein